MKRVLYIDAFSGVAGDMLLGALIDAGLPEASLRQALGSLGVDHEVHTSKVVRAGISATKVDVLASGAGGAGRHATVPSRRGSRRSHSHGADGHRSLADIVQLIGHAKLSKASRARAVSLVTKLAEVEASIHNVPIDRVHLHEVGAVDSIIDIVGCVFGIEWFGAEVVMSSPLNLGSGKVKIAHGTFPVPAPATLRLVAGLPVYAEGPETELTTPTGALLVSGHASRYGPMPSIVPTNMGYGAGSKDFADRPNVVRVVVGTEVDRALLSAERSGPADVVKVECEIDDMNPQLFGPVMDDLLELGAHDVFLTPVQMKKQRPGTLITVIAPPERRELLTAVLFDHTTTLGVRYTLMSRDVLERLSVSVQTPMGEVRVKVARRDGQVLNVAPEFDDCLRAAKASGVPVKLVQAQAMKVWLSGEGRGLPVSAPRKARPRSRRRGSPSGRVEPSGRNALRGKR